MPIKKIYDHMIKLKEVFIPRKRNLYSLSRKEREEIYGFIKIEERVHQTLEITSNSTSILYREKKDSKKRMVQNYKYLNKWIVRNNYPLSLDIV